MPLDPSLQQQSVAFPDSLRAPMMRPESQLFSPAKPAGTPSPAPGDDQWRPAMPDAASLPRHLHASGQAFATSISPKSPPVPNPGDDQWYPSFADSAPGPRRIHASSVPHYSSVVAVPARAPGDTQWYPSFPDRLPTAPGLDSLAGKQSTARPDFPPFVAKFNVVSDNASSPALHASQHLFATNRPPLAVLPRTPGDTQWYPGFPDSAPLSKTATANVLFATSISPKSPPTPAVGDDQWYPSFADRAPSALALQAASQQFVTNRPPQVAGDDSWRPLFPDAAPAPRATPAASQSFVTGLSPIFPIPRYPTDTQWYPSFADLAPHAPGRTTIAQSQFASAANVQPALPTQVFESHADSAQGAVLGAHNSPAAVFFPAPQPGSILPFRMVLGHSPDSAPSRAMAANAQLAVAPSPKPERPAGIADSGTRFPDSAPGTKLPSAVVPFLTLPPFPERASQVFDSWTRFPDSAKTAPRSPHQESFAALLTPVDQWFRLLSGETHVDSVPLPRSAAQLAPPITFILKQDVGFAFAPDAAPGRFVHPSSVPGYSTSTMVERTSVPSDWGARFPDSATRPSLPAYSQFANLAFGPLPEGKISLSWKPSFPDFAVRPSLPAGEHHSHSLPPSPIPDIPLRWQPSFADFAPGPSRPASVAPWTASWVTVQLGPAYQVVVALAVTQAAGDTLPVTYPG